MDNIVETISPRLQKFRQDVKSGRKLLPIDAVIDMNGVQKIK